MALAAESEQALENVDDLLLEEVHVALQEVQRRHLLMRVRVLDGTLVNIVEQLLLTKHDLSDVFDVSDVDVIVHVPADRILLRAARVFVLVHPLAAFLWLAWVLVRHHRVCV